MHNPVFQCSLHFNLLKKMIILILNYALANGKYSTWKVIQSTNIFSKISLLKFNDIQYFQESIMRVR